MNNPLEPVKGGKLWLSTQEQCFDYIGPNIQTLGQLERVSRRAVKIVELRNKVRQRRGSQFFQNNLHG